MSISELTPNFNNYSSDGSKSEIKPDGDTEININDNMADDSRKIFVGGLSWETNEEDLKKYFCDFGEVKSCVIKLDRFTNQSRGFGFVIFDSEDSVNKVLEHKEHILNKKKIDPKKAKPSREPQKKVFIGGIDPDMSEPMIKEYFSQFGEIENIETPFDIRKNKRKAYLFITFSNESEARKAAQQECQEINGKKFEVRIAVPRDQANRTKGWKTPNSSIYYPYTMMPYMYPEYLYAYMYSNPHLFSQIYNPYDYMNYDPLSLSRQFQTGLMISNNTNSNTGQPQSAATQQQQVQQQSLSQQQTRPKISPPHGYNNPHSYKNNNTHHQQQQQHSQHHNNTHHHSNNQYSSYNGGLVNNDNNSSTSANVNSNNKYAHDNDNNNNTTSNTILETTTNDTDDTKTGTTTLTQNQQ